MNYRAVNKKIATEPFKQVATEGKIKNGIAIIDTKIGMTGLKVVFGSALAPEGSTVYVMTDVLNKHKWPQEKYTIGDKEFILVPEEMVIIVSLEGPQYVYGTGGSNNSGNYINCAGDYKGEFGGE